MLLAAGLAPAHGEAVVQTPAATKPAVNFNSCAKPVWPRASLRNEETGTVKLAFLIDADGKVADTKIESSSGFPLLDMAAREGIARCTFKPAMVDGKPEKAWMKLAYVWSIESSPQISPEAWQDAKTRAARGEAKGEYDLAQLYLNGPSPDKDRPEAQRLLELAAAKNLGDAQFTLALMLMPPKNQADAARTVELLTGAAEKGRVSAQHVLGLFYTRGQLVPKDLDKGVAWLRKAHAGGHEASASQLGSVLMVRAGTVDQVAEAIALLRIGAERLDPAALYELGLAYEKGTGVDQDYLQAAGYYQKAVLGRSRLAMRALAAMYERGQGVRADAAEADRLRTMAASAN